MPFVNASTLAQIAALANWLETAKMASALTGPLLGAPLLADLSSRRERGATGPCLGSCLSQSADSDEICGTAPPRCGEQRSLYAHSCVSFASEPLDVILFAPPRLPMCVSARSLILRLTTASAVSASLSAAGPYPRLLVVSGHYNTQLSLLAAMGLDRMANDSQIAAAKWVTSASGSVVGSMPATAAVLAFELHQSGVNRTRRAMREAQRGIAPSVCPPLALRNGSLERPREASCEPCAGRAPYMWVREHRKMKHAHAHAHAPVGSLCVP